MKLEEWYDQACRYADKAVPNINNRADHNDWMAAHWYMLKTKRDNEWNEMTYAQRAWAYLELICPFIVIILIASLLYPSLSGSRRLHRRPRAAIYHGPPSPEGHADIQIKTKTEECSRHQNIA
jgi:hypothetical protein